MGREEERYAELAKEVKEAKPDELVQRGADLYQLYREKIVHEDGLVNFRITWLIVSQTFLFGAFAVLSTELLNDDGYLGICLVLIGVGTISTVATWFSVKAAFEAIEATKWRWDFVCENNWIKTNSPALPAVTGGGRNEGISFRGKYAALCLP